MKDLAFVFPGQGSQKLGMLTEFVTTNTLVTDIFAMASDILNYDLWQLCQEGPEENLNQTANTQPAILTASYAIWRAWQESSGPKPKLMAGHSLGEYTALVCAGVLNFTDAVSLVNQRGLFMQQAVENDAGAMAAIIGLDNDSIIMACEAASDANGTVSAANFNSIGQTVIAGHRANVTKACELATEKGARKTVILAVSVPSHCALMQPAAIKLQSLLEKTHFNNAETPVLNNVNAKVETDANAIKKALIAQLTEPVQWVNIIQAMAKNGIENIVECGPGKVLTGLNKRIDKNLNYYSINSPESLQQTLGALA